MAWPQRQCIERLSDLGGINAVNPPLMIRVRGLEDVPEAVVDEVKLAKRGLDEGREDFRAQHGRDIEVQLQIVP
jgi:hypothetical protein